MLLRELRRFVVVGLIFLADIWQVALLVVVFVYYIYLFMTCCPVKEICAVWAVVVEAVRGQESCLRKRKPFSRNREGSAGVVLL